MADRGYTEQFVDYSAGREDAPTLTMMVGLSGSGKSVLSKQWVLEGYGKTFRFNRDSLREMLYPGVTWEKGGKHNEEYVRRFNQEGVKMALRMGRNVIIDDTNCVRRTRYAWEEIARDARVKFRIVLMTTPMEECIARDAKRVGAGWGNACVGEIVIRRQAKDLGEATVTPQMYEVAAPSRPVQEREALRQGEFPLRLPNAPVVLCDVDGTLADHVGVRGPFDESKVLLDNVHEVVADWVRALYPHYNVVIVSGRHDTCGEDTVAWLEGHGIPFDHILMRAGGDNRSDFIIKKELLNELLVVLTQGQLAFVLDDRPQVVKMWRENGLKVYPVAGTTVHRDTCPYGDNLAAMKGKRRCPDCWALEDF
jgi:predicted kinase